MNKSLSLSNERPEDELFELWKNTPPGPDREQLVEQLIPFLRKNAYAICWIKLSDHRPDIVNDAVHRAISRLEEFRGDSKFSTWFHSIVHNLCMTEGRAIAREPNKTNIEDLANEPSSREAIEAKVELAELRERLDPREQELLDFKLKGFTEEEIALELGISRDNVHWRWNELRRKVRSTERRS